MRAALSEASVTVGSVIVFSRNSVAGMFTGSIALGGFCDCGRGVGIYMILVSFFFLALFFPGFFFFPSLFSLLSLRVPLDLLLLVGRWGEGDPSIGLIR